MIPSLGNGRAAQPRRLPIFCLFRTPLIHINRCAALYAQRLGRTSNRNTNRHKNFRAHLRKVPAILVVKITRLSPAVMPVLCGVLCRYEGTKRLIPLVRAADHRLAPATNMNTRWVVYRSLRRTREFKSCSLRQSVCVQRSPLLAFEPAEIAN